MAPDPSRQRWWLTLALLAAVWLGPGVAVAQEPAPPAAEKPADPTPPPIRPIPLEDVSERAEATLADLKALARDEEPEPETDEAAEDFQKRREDALERAKEVRAALATDPKVRTLEELERQLLTLAEPFTTRDEELDEQITAIGTALAEVDHQIEIWEKTGQAAREAGSSPTTLKRIAATSKAISQTRKKLVKQRNEVLTARDRLVDPRSEIDELLKQVLTARQTRLGDVFSSSRAPLWSQDVRDALVREYQEGLGDSLDARMQDVFAYVRETGRLLGFQLVLFVLLAAGLRALRARVREELEQHQDLNKAAMVFEYPTAMALVISLALMPELHPLAPRLLMRTLGVAAVIPAVIIVRRLVPGAMVPLVYGMLVFFAADRVREILATLPTLERVLLQAEMLGGLGFLLWLNRPSRLAQVSAEMLRDRTFRILGLAMRAALVILGVAFVADLIGFGDLADLLATATLRASYNALFIYAVTAALQSLAAYSLLVRPLQLLRGISRHRTEVRRRVDRVLRLGGTLIWAWVVLASFGIRDVAVSTAAAIVGAELSVGALSISLGAVAVFAVTVWVTFQLARLINFTLEEDVFPRVRLARGVPYAISSLVRYTIIVLGVFAALAAMGLELSKLTVIAGGLGVGIGFGMQNVVNNFVSGLILLFERPLQVGDQVQLPDLWGEITRIGIRASVIRTFDGAEVIVPNGLLISDRVTNWTLSDQRRRLEISVGVEYGTDAQRMIDLLLQVAKDHPQVIDDPEPAAFFTAFGDSSLDFLLRVWIPEFQGGYEVRSDIAIAIQRALKEAGIGVPFPQRDLHVRSLDPKIAAELVGKNPRSERE